MITDPGRRSSRHAHHHSDQARSVQAARVLNSYALGSFPAKGMIRDWLTAGVFERGKGFAPTEEGTPQGGVISPLLLNVALHGLESAAGVRYITVGRNAGDIKAGSPMVIRYADDSVPRTRLEVAM